MPTIAENIVIGRFQILQKGHAELFKRAYDKVVTYEGRMSYLEQPFLTVGIGVSGKGRTKRNPFTFKEVKGMINAFLTENQMWNVKILPIRDINNPVCYFNHVYQSLFLKEAPDEYTVFSNNNYLLDCVHLHDTFFSTQSIKSTYPDINATRIRKLLAEGNEEWKTLVPQSTINYIENEMGGVDTVGYLCRTCEDIR